ncbi:MAG: GIY-YIG nuclease family protein [Chloroflexota bacterium]|nr:GIY-YIG nuclease family protein [Chloroflexota bacterium]
MQSLPTKPGIYALLLALPEACSLQIGKIGDATFPAGSYIYLGSALGPGGIHARLGRHISGSTSHPYWHIDYLRPFSTVIGACYLVVEDAACINEQFMLQQTIPIECRWSQAAASLPRADIPLPGFGSSDCHSGCAAHLVRLPNGIMPDSETIQADISTLFVNTFAKAAGVSANDIMCL